MIFFKLFKPVVLNTIREDRLLTILSVIGIALGVGLFMGVNSAANRAIESFEGNVAGLDQGANYEVFNPSGIDFPEEVYQSVRAAAPKSLPLLVANAVLPDQKETAQINGVYTVKALAVLGNQPEGAVDVEAFLTGQNSVFITKRFGEQYKLRQGDFFRALVYNRNYRLVIAGVLDLASVPANTIYMDLGNFQELFKKTGELSRIDVLADTAEADNIARVLSSLLTLEKKEKLIRNRKAMVDAFRINLRFVTFLAVLVGVFLLYNTVFISVIKRRTEIGILRGLGTDRSTLIALFSAHGIILGFFGSLLGVVFGQAGAWVSTAMVGSTVSRFYGSSAAPADFMSVKDAAWTFVLGLGVSLIASIIPALESATVRPMESTRPGTVEKTYKSRQGIFSAIGIVLVVAGAWMTAVDYVRAPFNFPWLSHTGIVLFILGCTFNAPAYLGMVIKLLRPLLHRFRTAGKIAAGDMSGTRYRFSLALMSVAVSGALIVAIVSSIHSLKQSFVDWINTYVSADLYVKSGSCPSNYCFDPLPEEVVRIVEESRGVKTVGKFRSLHLPFKGSTIVAGFGDVELLWMDRREITEKEKERLRRLAEEREVDISEYLSVKYKLKPGDIVDIPTPKGAVPFLVNDTSISYSTMSGFMYLDRRWLREYWGLDDATQLSVYLEPGQDAREFIMSLRQSLPLEYSLDISDNSELRSAVLRIFDRSFAVTYTIELIAIVISLIGVVNALLMLVLEKKREISVLRYLGATWTHIRQIMVLSAGIIATAGILLGCVMGAAISLVITHVINRISFGWEVPLQVPWLTLGMLMSVLFITTVLAGIVPASLAKKIDPKAFVSFE